MNKTKENLTPRAFPHVTMPQRRSWKKYAIVLGYIRKYHHRSGHIDAFGDEKYQSPRKGQ